MMCSHCCFYLKLVRPITCNLGSRITNEMADLSANIKQKMFKNISFRFPSSPAGKAEDGGCLESIAEECSEALCSSSDCLGSEVQKRPLPHLPTDLIPISNKDWYRAIDRRSAEEVLDKSYDGNFVVRPSFYGPTQLAITVWYKTRAYNIPIRKRTDGQYALGTEKKLEQYFKSVEEMIENYKTEQIVLFCEGVEEGRTTLRTAT